MRQSPYLKILNQRCNSFIPYLPYYYINFVALKHFDSNVAK